jgi:membrane associated rhomboid family serine protease
MFRVPPSVLVLIAALVAAHAGRALSPPEGALMVANKYALDPVVYSGHGTLLDQLVVPVSHLFIHADLSHLIFNCLWLLVFGTLIARRVGQVAFLLFFFLCALAGSAAFVGLAWGQNIGLVGASGAISGLMGGAIRMLSIRQPWLNVAIMPLAPLISQQVLGFTAVWLAITLALALVTGNHAGFIATTAWQYSVASYFAGLLLAGPFDRFIGVSGNLSRPGA